jgi:hypothetical protein
MAIDERERLKRDLVAQWAFDTGPILARFHLRLEDVAVAWLRGEPAAEFTREMSFLDGRMERALTMGAAVTALGTKLFGRFGEGAGKPKPELNQVKKDADAISAYALSESLWFASRQLPENHAIFVSLGEGLMPKAGETPEMGSNPQLGFGRVYARPHVARWIDERVVRLLNDRTYGWDAFYGEIKAAGLTVWGAAIDTLENTSRFAKGADTGPMTVLHLFDQPLRLRRPYEGYMGNLILPREVVTRAAERSLLIDFRTPRAKVVEAIETTYPGIRREHVHVWTLGGKSRVARIGSLWEQWREAGAHVVEEGWAFPGGTEVFTESGTYAPVYAVGTWKDADKRTHLFLCDGYAASAEAMQAASLAPMLGLDASLTVFTSKFDLPWERERRVMTLDPDAPDFAARLGEAIGELPDDRTVTRYADMIREARAAGIPLGRTVIGADDFFPEKGWDVLALSGYMCPDPYTGAPGVESAGDGVWRVTVRLSAPRGDKRVTFVLRLLETLEEGRLVFNPLLTRFLQGEDWESRPVKISDSGRIRNELQTLCAEALEYEGRTIRVRFDDIPPDVIRPEQQKTLYEVLRWYKQHHPIWFAWLDVVGPGESAAGVAPPGAC